MKRILATTAIVMIMAGSAYAAQMGNYTATPQDVEDTLTRIDAGLDRLPR